jgi:hypothetical protein
VNELVKYLSQGEHAIEVALRPDLSVPRFKECIDRGVVHVKFPNTRGGTELGVRVDTEATDLSGANFEQGFGSVRLVGNLRLNYVDVRCIANIDLSTLKGFGHIEPIGQTEPM